MGGCLKLPFKIIIITHLRVDMWTLYINMDVWLGTSKRNNPGLQSGYTYQHDKDATMFPSLYVTCPLNSIIAAAEGAIAGSCQ